MPHRVEDTIAAGPKVTRAKATPPSTPPRKTSRQSLPTPPTRRTQTPSRNSTAHATDYDDAILVQGRGQIKTGVPYPKFRENFLSRLSHAAKPAPEHLNLFYISESQTWNEKEFARDILAVNPGLEFTYHAAKYPEGSNVGMPDFVITKVSKADASNAGAASRKHWRDVELVMGHSAEDSTKALDDKFGQWLRDIWSVFDQQPHRRFCFGVLFLQPRAFLCYADRGCAAASEPLEVMQK
ncbi:hypothetical protein BDR22DRAFT_889332 [Usnea florida]